MGQMLYKIGYYVVVGLLLGCGCYACASMAAPEGGDYDYDPPRFVGAVPAQGGVHVDKRKILLSFDEYITLEKPNEKVIITPPQQKMPVTKAFGKNISVELKDSLIPNTTYTFDFTDAIADNNEKNVLNGFTYAFSTGDVIDSLVIAGRVLNAEDLEPMPNIMVGIHSNLEDSAFTHLPFLRTSQTNEAGFFWIRNIAPGSYHLFALSEQNRNFRYDQSPEAIAFDTTLIVPSFEPAMRIDTIWRDTLTIDTIKEVHFTRFTPDDMLLRLFKKEVPKQYLVKTGRPLAHQLTMEFGAPITEQPVIAGLTGDSLTDDQLPIEAVVEYSPDQKTLTYWLTDSLVYQNDTLFIEVNYLATDTLDQLVSKTDTVKFNYKRPKAPKEPPKEVKKEPKKKKGAPLESDTANVDSIAIRYLDLKVYPSGSLDVLDTIKITFEEPVRPFDSLAIQISQKVDTLWEKRDYPIWQDSLNPRIYYIYHEWSYAAEYKMDIDSAAIFGIYDLPVKKAETTFKAQPEEFYAHLYVKTSGIEGTGFGELLDGGGKMVRTAPLQSGELIFENLKPGKYYLRYIDDANDNGAWDTGDYATLTQPEAVYYFPLEIELKGYMELEQSWNVTELPIDSQKPAVIVKNKPKEKQQTQKERKNEKKKR
ncbi:hypothetical protein SAMD00024442_35_19 [Candidatus Symbiothrix dinenymphae]|nr:hypothetical protein SAMD00024442_35_19 [Candidatus Symbiothrix dinenymphae]